MIKFYEKYPLITAAFVGYGFGTICGQLAIFIVKVLT